MRGPPVSGSFGRCSCHRLRRRFRPGPVMALLCRDDRDDLPAGSPPCAACRRFPGRPARRRKAMAGMWERPPENVGCPHGPKPSKEWENAGIGKKIGEKEGRRGKDAENLAFPIDKQAAAGYNICKGKRFTGPAAAGFLFVRFTFVRPR